MLDSVIPIETILYGLLLLPFIYFLIKYPEITFGLFISAGAYKADPRLSFLPEFLDLTVIFGSFSLIGVILKIMLKKTRFIVPPKKLLIPYLIIALLGIISLFYTPAPIYGTDKLLRFLTITSLSLFLPSFLFQKEFYIKKFFWVLIILSILMIIDIMSGGLNPGEIGFHTVFGSNYLAVGRNVGTALIIILFYFLLIVQNKIMKLVCLCLIPFMMFGILISGGRGPLVSLGGSILIVIIYITVTFFKKFVIDSTFISKNNFKILGVIVSLIIITAGLFVTYSDYFLTVYRRLALLQEGGGDSALERASRFKSALAAMLTFPEILTGLGIGGFSAFYLGIDAKRGAYPHNIFLELGSELGILGLIAIILFIYWGFSNVLSSLKVAVAIQSNKIFLSITLLALLVFMVINSSVSGDINDNRFLFTWIGLIFTQRKFAVAKN